MIEQIGEELVESAIRHRQTGVAQRMLATAEVERTRGVATALGLPAALHSSDESGASQWSSQRTVVIAGLPRTGTTLLHHLLALSPHVGAPTLADLHSPHDSFDEGVKSCDRYLALVDWLSPDLRQQHPMAAEWPEECIFSWQYTFISMRWPMILPMPEYLDFLEGIDATSLLRWHFASLARRQGLAPVDGALVLKAPAYSMHVEALIKLLPGAILVSIDRDRSDAMASFERLVEATLATTRSSYDPEYGQAWRAHWQKAEARWSGALKESAASHRVTFENLVSDPVAVVEGLCGALELEVPGTKAIADRVSLLRAGPKVASR